MIQKTSNKSSLPVLISVFFFWGYLAASNTILIPILKSHFELKQWQSQMVDFAFYLAYFVGSLIYFLISYSVGDPLGKIGYKKGLIVGLIISAIGAIGMVPATNSQSIVLMLTSLFVIALGFALQQIVANPYVIAIGDPHTGSHRISLAGGVNSFGTTIGPLILGYAIFGSLKSGDSGTVALTAVQTPFIILCGVFLLVAVILSIAKLPPITQHEHVERSMGAFKYPQLVFGMIAIFIYVGVEVTIQSNLPALMKKPNMLGLDNSQTVHFISMYWGSLMIGRWVGAITVFNFSKIKRQVMTVIVPLIAYAVILGVNYIKLSSANELDKMNDLYYYFPFVLILIACFFMAQEKPARTMMLFASMAGIMMIIGLLTEGKLAVYSFMSGGLFCSVMWPCIFSLSLAGLGKYTTQGSSLLIMMILGGALIPPLQGYISDQTKDIHLSYIIPVLCFAYLAFYGWKSKKILQSQGIDYDESVSKGVEMVGAEV
jgi:MFS transporter, FHS family, L-fucose permease